MTTKSERTSPFLLGLGKVALLLTALTPILVLPGYFFPFVTTRNIFFRLCVELAVAMVLLAGVRRLREIRGGSDPILKWYCIYVIALGCAALFGLSPWHSLFGDFERMGGVWAWLHLLLFYIALRVLLTPAEWFRFFRAIVLVSDLIVIWGASEFLPAAIRNPQFSMTLSAGSTIGNPGLLGPYLLLTFALSCWLIVAERRWWWKAFVAVSAVVQLFGLGGARNRSSELGLLAGAVVGLALFLLLQRGRKGFVRKFALAVSASVVVVVVAVYATAARAPDIANQFSGRWKGFLASPVDHLRTIEWKIAIKGFEDRPVFGYGPENHQIISSNHFDPAIYAYQGGGIFDRTHNAWLELLATTGIVGALAMIAIWIAVIATIRAGVREKTLSAAEAAVLSGALAAYAVYLTFWFFDINSVFVWTAILAFVGSRVRGQLDVASAPTEESPAPRRMRIPTFATVALIAMAAYLHGVVPLIAARNLSVASSGGFFEYRLDAFTRVLNSAAPQTMHTFPIYYRFLRSSLGPMTSPNANPLLRKEYDLAMQRGLIEADRSIARNSHDDRSYVDAARFSMLGGLYYKDGRYLLRARDQLFEAVKLSPRRPDVRVLLSGVLSSLGDSAGAKAQLDSALVMAPEFSSGYFYAGKMYLARGNPDSAATLLLAGLRRNYSGAESVYDSAVTALVKNGRADRAAQLDESYLSTVYRPLSTWGLGTPPWVPQFTPLAERLADRLPLLYKEAGQANEAIAAALAFAAVRPAARSAALEFKTDLTTGQASRWSGKQFLVLPPDSAKQTGGHGAGK